MTISSEVARNDYVGTGSVSTYAYTFKVLNASDLKVTQEDTSGVQTVLTNGVHYTVTGVGSNNGGNVVLSSNLSNGYKLNIRPNLPYTQLTDLRNQGGYLPDQLEDQLDRQVRLTQQIKDRLERSITAPETDTILSLLPRASSRANRMLGFNADGNPTVLVPEPGTAAAVLTDLANTADNAKNSALVGFKQSGTGAVTRTVAEKLREWISVKDFGAIGDGVANDSVAVQAALDSGSKSIVVPAGTYLVDNLTMTTEGQRLIAIGRVTFKKRANGPIITCSGASQGIEGIEFQGVSASFTGSNVVSSGNFFHFKSGSEDAASYALDCSGGAPTIEPGPWRIWTADATANGYDIRIGGVTAASLYGRIIGQYSSQTTGGILLKNTGAVSIFGGQFGKLTVQLGSSGSGNTGPQVTSVRITGAVVIEQSSTQFSACKFGGNVTIGDGSNAISGILFGPDNLMQGGTTLTINDLVQGSSIHLGQLYSGGVTVSINSGALANNDFFHGAISYTPTFTAVTTNPAVGNGTLAGSYSRSGRTITATFSLIGGSTTTWGSGAFRLGLPIAIKAATGVQKLGSSLLVDASTGDRFAGVTYGSPGNAYMNVEATNVTTQATGQASSGWPFTFTNGDAEQVYGQLTYDC